MRVDDQDEEFFVDESSDHRAWTQNLGWLADVDRDKAMERVDRLAGDRELAAALRLDGFIGQNHDAFANEIARYGWAVIRGWIYKGQIARRSSMTGAAESTPFGTAADRLALRAGSSRHSPHRADAAHIQPTSVLRCLHHGYR